MSRAGRLAALALALSAAAGARAAEPTRIASDAGLSDVAVEGWLRWERTLERALVTREVAGAGGTTEVPELRVQDVRNQVVPRVAVGWRGAVELHAELPWVLGAEDTWTWDDPAAGPTGTVGGNTLDADGRTCATVPCPLFAVGSDVAVRRGSTLGDLLVGATWAVLSERRDLARPTWVVGADLTLPTAHRYDPAAGRAAQGGTWRPADGGAAPIGQRAWRLDLSTAVSRRTGNVDPYLRAHLGLAWAAADAYSNCDHVAELAGADPSQMAQEAVAACATAAGRDAARGRPPAVAGLAAGVELTTSEDPATGRRTAVDLRVIGDWTTSGRWYNELTDATGKLLATGDYLTARAQLGFVVRAPPSFSLRASLAAGTSTAHALTGERPPPAGGTNANFDWRWDPAGRRFMLRQVWLFDLRVAGVVQF